MLELGPDNVVEYLRSTGQLSADCTATAELLAWGVSNVVLRVEPSDGESLVVKQSRAQLRTETPWFSRLDRIWREMEVMQVLAGRLPAGAVPRVLFADRENYVFGMEAVPEHTVWKGELLAGRADRKIAVTAADYLAAIHRETADAPDLRERWGDREVFIQLRVDPFYRHVARVHPELRDPLERLIEEMFQVQVCVTHADFSPKNMLITSRGVTLVDYETAHYGDPAFDLGFFLSHLLLKTVLYAPRCEGFLQLPRDFWDRYQQQTAALAELGAFASPEFQSRAVRHLAGCMLARIDGTSTIDYLREQGQQDFVRRLSKSLLTEGPRELAEVFGDIRTKLEKWEFGSE